MKWTAIVLNILAAIGFFVLGSVAISIHRVHRYSTYREFISVGAVDEQKLATIQQPANLPRSEHYDMPARMRQTGNAAEFWFECISGLAALACIINAIGIFFPWGKAKTAIVSALSLGYLHNLTFRSVRSSQKPVAQTGSLLFRGLAIRRAGIE